MTSVEALVTCLRSERQRKYKSGIYYLTQTEFAYNSNHIEGSKLTRRHTESLFTTRTLVADAGDIIRSDDVTETVNHFRAFDRLLDTLDEPLTETIIKTFHRILKANTSDADLPYFRVGDYKTVANIVGDRETTPPEDVPEAMVHLLAHYNERAIDFDDLLTFHVRFERIHPFQDGNGRVGRLILFRECLRNDIIPFIIDAEHRDFYCRGLYYYDREPGYLRDTCLSAQDHYTAACQKLVPGFSA